ncbi:tok1-voltage outward-rectifying k+ channel [Fusarium heterosporum]|uniref:Tok1-voltage outward-rectifying k+ channel n=1 Tax=Fusarium heterosporum TaxID=42747 RepID=A0A8H5WGD3_FUSHE|nr:tok1-voltage outward-rectifying k+ channel [Fusarium heterosporum]
MDDGDLGDNIQQETDVIEEAVSHERRVENDDAHLAPSRWWFASSAFPMIAGTLGPVASAFSICALVRPWRQHLYPGKDVYDATYVPDPVWLITINAIQLAMAVVSNAFLLLNMTRRVRFTIAQPITIVGWYISAILLIALLATAANPLYEGFGHPSRELIWSQAFYYGLWAAILYFIDASLMLVTFYGAWTGHYSKDFNLTPSQRTLMLQTIMFLMYLLLGALVFSNIEDWNYLDAVYWADITLFTVGFGDFRAQTTLGRALMMPYALVGVISLGLVIGSIRSLVLERGKRQVDARMEEKKRRHLVRSMTKKGNDDVLEPIRGPDRQDSAASQGTTSNRNLPATEFERRKVEFELMRKIQAQTSSRRRWMAMAISTSVWLILWLLGAYIFVKCEENYQGWTYFDGFYFCFVSLLTIGYGDKTPISNAGKSFFVFWSLLALPTMTVLISNAGDTVVKLIRDGTLRLGNVTILPGEGSFTHDLKYIINQCTFGWIFPDYTEPPMAQSNAKNRSDAETSSNDTVEALVKADEGSIESTRGRPRRSQTGEADSPDERPVQNRHNSTYTTRVRRSLSRLRNAHDELPTGTDLHFLLVSEIQVLTKHLKSSKPHTYSFEKWAWYLKLIGEDENDADKHRKAQPKRKHQRHNNRHHHHHNHRDKESTHEEGHDKSSDSDYVTAWSWVDNRSPLMGSQEETEWILDRLLERLRESLSAEGRKQVTADARRALGVNRRPSSDDVHHRDQEKTK